MNDIEESSSGGENSTSPEEMKGGSDSNPDDNTNNTPPIAAIPPNLPNPYKWTVCTHSTPTPECFQRCCILKPAKSAKFANPDVCF